MYTDPSLTVSDFMPRLEDEYYPAEEQAEAAGLAIPRIGELAGDSALIVAADGSPGRLNVGEVADDWRLLALTESPLAAVFERRFRRWGILAYVGKHGPVLTVRLPVGRLDRITPDDRRYPQGYEEAILTSRPDLLGEKVLGQGEPSYEAAAGLLPEFIGYVPLSGRSAPNKVVVGEAGCIGVIDAGYGQQRVSSPLFDPSALTGGLTPTKAKRGLLGGHLPGIHYAFWDAAARDGWEEIAFALGGQPETVYVALIHQGVWRCFTLSPLRELDSPGPFFEALATFCGQWERQLSQAVQIDLPEPRLRDASLAAVARALTTRVGDRPKYGLGTYAADIHDAFPPTTLWTANACLEWGLLDEARRTLTYYLEHFVKDDGAFDYYGPAVSEYGQVLDVIARYVRYTGEIDWLRAHAAKVQAIAAHLLSLRLDSLKQPGNAITRGLLYGSPEADTHKETEYYLSGSAWAWRGLLELARVLRDHAVGAPFTPPGELARECDALREDILRAARASLVPGDPPFLPPYPGAATPFPSMTADTLASYTNYRYWPELLSAEALDADLADAVLEYRRRRGGELMATTRFADGLDDWPFAHQARGVLAADRVDQYLLGLYGHLAAHQMPGTFCAYEGVHIRGTDHRTYMADYCVPAQLTVPLLVRWMLVYEERDSDTLWLCKAVPRRWFAPGRHFRVRNAPTRWGPVSFRVSASDSGVEVEVVPPPRAPEQLLVRVRRPGHRVPKGAQLNGHALAFDSATETVTIPHPAGSPHLRVAYE